MQTMYYTTTNFIRHTGNVVDLQEYRRRLERSRGSARQEEAAEPEAPRPRAKGAPRRRGRGLALDCCASLGVVIMTVTFTLRILCL